MARCLRSLVSGILGSLLLAAPGPASAFTLAFSSADFSVTPAFSNVQQFSFTIEVSGPLVPGAYVDPAR